LVALTINNISKSFGADEVLKNISLMLTDEQRLGLVGPNGAGKTTLLRIISGEMAADSGSVSIANPAGLGYLSQEVPAGTQDTVWQTMLAVFDDVFAMEKRMRELEHEMADAAADSDAWRRVSREYERVTRAFEEADGYGYKSAIGGVLKGLGLEEETFEQPVDTLSGGQRARLALGRLLLKKPTLLLLDEPTNHLDAGAIEWLEGYLKSWRGAVILVSHDRWFLDQLCTHVAGLYNNTLSVETGNYSAFAMKRQEQRHLQQKAYEHNQKEIKRQEAVIERYKVWGRSGGGKNFIKAQARQHLLDKMERVERPDAERARMSLQLDGGASGEDVLTAENLSMSFGDKSLFEDLSFRLFRGDSAALVGPNGVGKTTLLRIVAGRLMPLSGDVELGTGVKAGYYDQLQEGLSDRLTVIEELREAYPSKTDAELRNMLAGFLFFGDDVFKPISALSGGEKGRLALLKLMMARPALLLLDEPTNHLDMDSREALEDALIDFDGTILFVSHDRYFINRVASRVLELKDRSLTSFEGNWSDYQAMLEARKNAASQPAYIDDGLTKTEAAKRRRLSREEEQRAKEAQLRVTQIEKEIAQAEQRLQQIETKLADPSVLKETDIVALSGEHEAVQRQIEALMDRWEQACETS
jgi:ATP-binding cassette subfamily F protein 3